MNNTEIQALAASHGTPLYIYERDWLERRAESLLACANKNDVLVRYALKANPHPGIISLFDGLGLHFDASSEYEAAELMAQGVKPDKISLSSQQPPGDLTGLLEQGVQFVATSLHQLELLSHSEPRGGIGVRINPGIGSGHNQRTTTGGVNASFGIWHEYLPKVLAWQQRTGYQISRLHVHVGSGGDTHSWKELIEVSLRLAEELEHLNSLDMGGGFKVARMPGEKEADINEILNIFQGSLADFNARTARKLGLEIEPGTWLVAGGGCMVSRIVDIVDTGRDGYTFLKLDTGMNDILRPALYGAQHPLTVLNDATAKKSYVVVGHNCESGDLLSSAPGDPETIAPRLLNEARIGDLMVIGAAGAYGASMRAVGYNSFPSAREILA